MIKNIRMDDKNIFVKCFGDSHYNKIMAKLADYKINQDYLIIRDIMGKNHYFSGGRENINVEELEKVYE